MEWFESVLGPTYASALMWTGVALLGLIVLLVIFRLLRSLGAGTFVSGGRNRKARLAIMDAAAVDNQRRLVLVRRDDVEHLILIGGGNDLVVERDIRLVQPASPRMEAARESFGPEAIQAEPQRTAAAPRPAPQRREPAPLPRQEPVAPAPRPQPPRQVEQPSTPRPVQSAPPVAARQPLAPAVPPPMQLPADYGVQAPSRAPSEPAFAQPAPQPSPPAPAPAPVAEVAQNDLDDDLLQELQFTLDEEERQEPRLTPAPREPRVDDEMDRLLGELSGQRR